MEWSRIKNIIILILLLLNGFLLALLVGSQYGMREYQQSALTGAARVLEQNGISVSPDLIRETAAQPVLSVVRDMAAEETLARAVLGDDIRSTDQSGGLNAFTGAGGTAIFRSSCEYNIHLTDCPTDGLPPEVHAAGLLERLGLTGELLSAPRPGQDGEVVFCQTLDGVPVYSCLLSFQYRDDRLQGMSGTLLTGSTQAAENGGAPLDLPNVLIHFLRGILERGDVCSAVTGLRQGYRLTQSFGADPRLTPVWLVTTNVGSYYLDSILGGLEPADL